MKKLFSVVLLLSLFVLTTSGCSLFLKDNSQKKKGEKTVLTYYRFGDDADVIKPLLDSYQSAHPNISIQLVTKFLSFEQYEDRLINGIAEGAGPDLFSVPNTWIYKHDRKIAPMPTDMGTVDQFRQSFVAVADRDLVRPDPQDAKTLRVFGVPMYVDTLAAYYNKAHYEDRIPSRGRPAELWKDFIADVASLTKPDGNGGFEVSGAALGRTDNTMRGLDLFYSLVLQYGGSLYAPNGMSSAIKTLTVRRDDGQIYPFAEAVNFFIDFAKPGSANYTWAKSTQPSKSDDELLFAQGRVSTIFGYSDTYDRIVQTSKNFANKGLKTIAMKDIGIAPMPQFQDPRVSTNKRDVLASYMFETVSRNSKYQKQAWDLLLYLGGQKNEQYYNQKSHKPTSRRDLLDAQSKDPIYGVFAQQVGFASSLPLYDGPKVDTVIDAMITSMVDGSARVVDAIATAEGRLNSLLSGGGFVGPGPHVVPKP